MSLPERVWVDVPCENRDAAPSSRYGSVCAVYNDCLYVFGGSDGTTFTCDLHEFSFSHKRWRVVPATGHVPSARCGHSCVVYKDALFVFGGWDGRSCLNDLSEYNFLAQEWRVVVANGGSAPSPRMFHSAVVYNQSMFCFGGDSDRADATALHAFNFETRTWTLVHATGAVPSPRYAASLIVVQSSAILFGGYNRNSGKFNDLYMFDFDRRVWSTVVADGFAPAPRHGHVAVIHANAMYVFGGSLNSRKTNELHKLTLGLTGRRKWQFVASEGKPPSPCSFSSGAVYDSSLVVFGGQGNGKNFSQFRLDEPQPPLASVAIPNSLLRPDRRSLTNSSEQLTKLGNEVRAEFNEQLSQIRFQRQNDSHIIELSTCPISMDIMRDPVITPSGVTYERAQIEQHLDRVGLFDPTTKTPLTKTDLYPNRAIKNLVEKHFPDYAH